MNAIALLSVLLVVVSICWMPGLFSTSGNTAGTVKSAAMMTWFALMAVLNAILAVGL